MQKSTRIKNHFLPELWLILLLLGCASNDKLAISPGDENPWFSDVQHIEVEVERFSEGFIRLQGIYATNSGNVYLVEGESHRLLRLNESGGRTDSIGGRGMGDYQFDDPVWVDASNDLKIYITDVGNRRIQMFDRRFQFLGTVRIIDSAGRNQNYEPGPVATNKLGEVYFWNQADESIRKLNTSSQVDESFRVRLNEISGDKPVKILPLRREFVVLGEAGRNLYRFSETGRYLGYWSGLGRIRDIAISADQPYVLTDNFVVKLAQNGQIKSVIPFPENNYLKIAGSQSRIYLMSRDFIDFFDVTTGS